MDGDGLLAERAREALTWVEEEAHGLSQAPAWVRELLRRAFHLPGDGEPMEGEGWRERLVRELLASFALCGEDMDLSAFIPRDGQTLWRWFLSHPSRRERFLQLLTDPPCEAGEQALWLKAILATPLRGLLQLAFTTEVQDVAAALREGLHTSSRSPGRVLPSKGLPKP